MENNKNKVTVSIFDSSYTVIGSESAAYINKLAIDVDKCMRKLSNDMHLRPMQTAVLTAMNFCDAFYKEKQKNMPDESIKKELEKLITIKTQYNALLEENKFLKTELKNERLRNKK